MTATPSEHPAPGRRVPRRDTRHVVRTLLAPLAVVLVVALGVGVLPLPGAGDGAGAPPACAAPATAGTIRVAVAVDPGGVAGMTGGPETLCVTVPEGATGADVLVARARALGRPVPRYNGAGLLCSIDGQPASGCGVRVDGTYQYWAYFLGGDGWTYAGTGPALRRARAGQLEGWRFVAGAGNPTDPPPRTTASPADVCPPELPPPPPPTVPLPVAPAPSGGGGAPEVSGPGSATGGGTTFSGGSGGGGDRGAPTVDPGRGSADDATPAEDGAVGDPSGGGGRGGAGDTAGDIAGDGDGRPPGDEVAGAALSETSASGGPQFGVVLAVALVAALAVGAVVQVRRRESA